MPIKTHKLLVINKMAEGVGFEPTGPCGPSVFKTDAIDHSATPPGCDLVERGWGDVLLASSKSRVVAAENREPLAALAAGVGVFRDPGVDPLEPWA